MDSQFDSIVAAYEQSMNRLPFREHVEAYSLLKAIGSLTGLAVLDLGCGTGLYARRFRALGAKRVVGMDTSQSMIEYARRKEEQERHGITYVHHNATRSLDDGLAGAFDLVTSVYVLPYATSENDLAGMCATARQALSPRGAVRRDDPQPRLRHPPRLVPQLRHDAHHGPARRRRGHGPSDSAGRRPRDRRRRPPVVGPRP
ncbi:class I SAM-dependent methyltransferase [Streptomyces halobius]|uniref:Class I SAM-dependent methyltransferase n=1 Tax=Streptomyces halobius TaxID=2879846 RepID=A0ABY4M4J8_9ACTN|nr:class I SAM-dependent methyltransferase [Streptomyces halobius]